MKASVAGHNIIAGTAPDSEFWEHSLLIISYTTKSFESHPCLLVVGEIYLVISSHLLFSPDCLVAGIGVVAVNSK